MVEVVWGVDSGLAGLGKDGPLPSLGIVGSGRSGPSRVSEATKMSPAQKTEIQETEIGMNTPTLLSHTHLGLKPLGCSLSRQQLAGLPFSHVQHKRPACKVPPGPDAPDLSVPDALHPWPPPLCAPPHRQPPQPPRCFTLTR